VKAIPLSNQSLIITNISTPAELPFFGEPKHTWCYYYTKAELARQQNNWEQAIHLFDEATSLGYEASDPFELLVFIEAHAVAGDIEAAEKLSKEAMMKDKGVRKGLCQVWKRVRAQDPRQEADKSKLEKIWAEFQCVP
jgi:uncharacterized protein HemY